MEYSTSMIDPNGKPKMIRLHFNTRDKLGFIKLTYSKHGKYIANHTLRDTSVGAWVVKCVVTWDKCNEFILLYIYGNMYRLYPQKMENGMFMYTQFQGYKASAELSLNPISVHIRYYDGDVFRTLRDDIDVDMIFTPLSNGSGRRLFA